MDSLQDVKLNITHNPEDLSIDEAISAYTETKDGFIYPLGDVAFKYDEFVKFIDEIHNIFDGVKKFDYSRGKNNIFYKFKSDDLRMFIRGNSIDIFGSIYAKTEESLQLIWDAYDKHTKEESAVEMFTYSYSVSNGQLQEVVKVFRKDEMDYISDKYYPYINCDIMLQQFFTGAENILLLVGEPGLGKSKLSTLALKYAIQNPEIIPYDKMQDNPALENQFISTAFVKSTDVLANDTFWRTLEKNTPDFCIIDDLDYMLTKRDAEVMSQDDAIKNAFLNQFLSYTDGVEKNKTKFIITTNQTYDEIDSALLRKGRLFDILELRKLDKAEALSIWKDNGLNDKTFHELFTSHEVLPAELGSEINKRMNNRITTATQSYLREDGISKIDKAGRKKKIGI